MTRHTFWRNYGPCSFRFGGAMGHQLTCPALERRAMGTTESASNPSVASAGDASNTRHES